MAMIEVKRGLDSVELVVLVPADLVGDLYLSPSLSLFEGWNRAAS